MECTQRSQSIERRFVTWQTEEVAAEVTPSLSAAGVDDLLVASAAAHVADALAYRDYGDYGAYGVHGTHNFMSQQRSEDRIVALAEYALGKRDAFTWRVFMHHIYYSNAGIKLLRMLAMLTLQFLVLVESPPWCARFNAACGADVREYHMSGMPLLSRAEALAVEGASLSLLLLDLAVRAFVHGSALYAQRVELAGAAVLLVNLILFLISACSPFSWREPAFIGAAWYLFRRAIRMPVYILRARRLRRDLGGVMLAGKEISEMLSSLG